MASIKKSIQSKISPKEKAQIIQDPGRFLKTNVEGFDKLVDKGIPKGSSVLLSGGAGCGKTLFGLQLVVQQATMGKKCLYISFEENKDRLIEHIKEFGWEYESIKENLIIQNFSPFDFTKTIEAMISMHKGEIIIDMSEGIIPENLNPEVIVMDSLTSIESIFNHSDVSYRMYIEQLIRYFQKIGSTNFFITETSLNNALSNHGAEEFLADGVIVFYNIKRGNIRERAIEVLKMRGIKHSMKMVAFTISENGLIIYPDQEIFGDIH